ncbi:hypothetical protein ABZ799_28850 [Nocardiopsis dassonvillei]|uniref:hypothetical protein n=1 Tax=Nocardiopsis dassonvillei TaxID=2014 RepID=UPI0033E737DD
MTNPTSSAPYRLVLPDVTSWQLGTDGLYRADYNGLALLDEPGEPRTRADLEAAGGVPVEDPPQEEIDELMAVLKAAGRHRDASIRSGWLDAMNRMVREFEHLGGLYRLYSGRPGCWEVDALRRMEHGYSSSHVVDPAAETAVCDTAVRWTTGDYVAHPEVMYEVCIGAWQPAETSA